MRAPYFEEARAILIRSVTAAERLLAPLLLAYRSISSTTSNGMVKDIRRLVTGPFDMAPLPMGRTINVSDRRRRRSVIPKGLRPPAANIPIYGAAQRPAHMAKYDGLLGQPVLEVEEPDKEGGITVIFKDNRFLFIKAAGGKVETVSIPE